MSIRPHHGRHRRRGEGFYQRMLQPTRAYESSDSLNTPDHAVVIASLPRTAILRDKKKWKVCTDVRVKGEREKRREGEASCRLGAGLLL